MEQELLHTFKKSYFLKISADKHLLAQTNATQVNVFKYDTLQQLIQIKADNAEPFFSNDSSLLLIKESYKKLYVYDTETMTLHSKLTSSKGCYDNGHGHGACISHNNKYVINIGYDHPYGFISVYNIENREEIRYREGLQEVYRNIQYIPSRQLYFIDGYRRLNLSGKNKYFYLWFNIDKQSFEQTFCDLEDANFLYTESLDQILYYSQRGKTAFRFLPLNIEIPVEHKYDIFDVKLSHNNEMIALYHGRELKVYTFPNMKILADFPNVDDYGRVSFSPDDKEILIASRKGFIYKLN